MNDFKGLIAIGVGLFSFFCAFSDYDWFMNNHKAKFFTSLFGRKGARIFYMILGLALIGMGLFIAVGGVH